MSDEDLPAVFYRHAMAWTCLDCGKANYEEGMVDENPCNHDDFQSDHPEHDFDADGGEWVHMPSVVTCKVCSKKFRIAHDHDEIS